MSYFEFRHGMSERIAKQLMSLDIKESEPLVGWEAENCWNYVIDIQSSMNSKEPLSGGECRNDQAMNGVNRGPHKDNYFNKNPGEITTLRPPDNHQNLHGFSKKNSLPLIVCRGTNR